MPTTILIDSFKYAMHHVIELAWQQSLCIVKQEEEQPDQVFQCALQSKVETHTIFTPMLQSLLSNKVEHLRLECLAGEHVQASYLHAGILALYVQPCNNHFNIGTNLCVALIDDSLQRQRSKTKHVAAISTAEQLKRFKLDEEDMFAACAKHLQACKVNIVYCTGTIHDLILHYLSQYQITAYANISAELLLDLSRVSHATIVHQWQHVQAMHLGIVKHVQKETHTHVPCMRVVPLDNQHALYTLLIRAATSEFCMEYKRHVEDAWQSYQQSLLQHGEQEFVHGAGNIYTL